VSELTNEGIADVLTQVQVEAMVERLRKDAEYLTRTAKNFGMRDQFVEAADMLQAIAAERDAEKLKRRQAEHERDCILEELAEAQELLRKARQGEKETRCTRHDPCERLPGGYCARCHQEDTPRVARYATFSA